MKVVWCVLFSALVFAQAPAPDSRNVLTVEQSVPFGTVSGQLLALPDNLVFVDQQQPQSSLVIPRSNVESVDVEGQTITVRARQPIRDRSGEASRMTFRVLRGDVAAVTGWYNTPASNADRVGNTAVSAGANSFEATHDHTFGSCHGRLIISPTQLVYESIDNRDHSRRWEYSAISELNQPNPYEIQIKPATGGDYKLKLAGQGMDPAVFKQLVDRVTAARAGVKR